MLKDRAPKAGQLLAEHGLDGFCFFHLPNIRYLCGFTGSDGALAVTAGGDCFLCDSRYTSQAQAEVTAAEIREYRIKADGVAAWLREQGVRRVGFEAEHLSCAALRRLREQTADGCEWVPLEEPVAALRGVKCAEEVAWMEEATRISAAAFDEVLPLIQPGVPEREIALALEIAMKTRGGEEKSFDIIVASGVRGALPHGVASTKLLAGGELVTIDFGVRCHGYHSDETVTVALGEVGERLREIHAVVLEAHDRAIAAIRPGVDLKQIDAVARDFIGARGYGSYFGHGLGHGVGLGVHEYPTVSPRSAAVAVEGMVFTVEPGIYIPNLGGVRIEDMVLVTAEGCRLLTRLNKNLLVLAD